MAAGVAQITVITTLVTVSEVVPAAVL